MHGLVYSKGGKTKGTSHSPPWGTCTPKLLFSALLLIQSACCPPECIAFSPVPSHTFFFSRIPCYPYFSHLISPAVSHGAASRALLLYFLPLLFLFSPLTLPYFNLFFSLLSLSLVVCRPVLSSTPQPFIINTSWDSEMDHKLWGPLCS